MKPKPKMKTDGRTITVRVPIAIRKRGGRKVVLAPGGAPDSRVLTCRAPDNAMIKALGRAFRWRRMLEDGQHATIKEIADAEDINESYVARILRLTLLAPNVVETIIEGRQPPEITLPLLMKRFSPIWTAQRLAFQIAV